MFVNIATESNVTRRKCACAITFTTKEKLCLTFIISKCDTVPFEHKDTYNICFFQSSDHLISPTIIRKKTTFLRCSALVPHIPIERNFHICRQLRGEKNRAQPSDCPDSFLVHSCFLGRARFNWSVWFRNIFWPPRNVKHLRTTSKLITTYRINDGFGESMIEIQFL